MPVLDLALRGAAWFLQDDHLCLGHSPGSVDNYSPGWERPALWVWGLTKSNFNKEALPQILACPGYSIQHLDSQDAASSHRPSRLKVTFHLCVSYILQAKGCILSKYNHTLLQEPRLTVCINNTFDKKIRMAVNIPASPWPSEAFKLEMNDKEKKIKRQGNDRLDCS